MIGQREDCFAFWYVIRTNPKQEERADSNLRAWKVETFSPKLKVRRHNPYTGEPTYVIKPLFPGYIFARFKLDDMLHKVGFTRGVHSVVSFGDSPTPIDDEIIDMVQARVAEDGFVRIREEFRPGEEVVIKEGPLKSIAGVFERELEDSDRVMILLQTINYQARVSVDRELVKKLNSPGCAT